ncbi:MAG: TorF family putative porin [Pseudomonadota bacterium]
MKKLVVSLALALGMLCQVALAPAPALAGEKEWTVDLAAAYNSKYIWRGIMQVDDPVLQPSLNVNKGGLTFNIWGSYNLTDKNDYGQPHGNGKNKFTELDLTAEYAFSLAGFTIPVGVIHYAFPNTGFEATTEVYAGVAYSWVITPSIKVFKDIDESHGTYVLGSLAYSLDLPSPAKQVSWGLAASISAAWADKDNNKFYWGGTDSDAFTDSLLTIGVPIKIMEFVTLTPAFNQVWLLDSKVKDVAGYDSKSYFGVTLSVSF